MSEPQRTLVNRALCVIGKVFFRSRNALFPIVFVLMPFVTKPYLGSVKIDMILVSVGAAVALLGEAVRCLTIGLVYIIRGGKDGRVYATNLVRTGMYAHSRNPMYVGNLLITAGVSVMYGSVIGCAVLVPFFLIVYLGITAEEEGYLAGRFGAEYEDYRRTVNRFFPSLHGLRETLQQHRFDWRQVLRKEYGTLFGLLMGMYLLALWKRYLRDGGPALREHAMTLAIPAVALVLVYCVVRFLKKTKRLESV
jgi:protein-S-isoprenylcysteine O-methyltransferase Ste14